jgi:lipid II:glycine glycyltransferase (peptidoglycan interpeptide bridge formation enzyme)
LKRRFAGGRCFYYLPQGPVLPADEADAASVFEEILFQIDQRRRVESRTVSHLAVEPRWETKPAFVQGFRERSGWREPRVTLLIDLAESEDAILAQMKQKGRYNIRVASRSGVSIVDDPSPAGLDDFYSIYCQTMVRHGIKPDPFEHYRVLLQLLLEIDGVSLLFAEYQGQRLATAFIIHHGDTASYKFGGSVEEHRAVMAPYLLHFEAIRAAKARGRRWYDFCGLARTEDPSDKHAGFSAFKRKFGGQVRNFIPALDYIYDQEAYATFG